MTSTEILQRYAEAETRASKKPGQLARVFPGVYLVEIEGELVEIEQMDEGSSRGWWIARETNQRWYSDPMPTLYGLKEYLGI